MIESEQVIRNWEITKCTRVGRGNLLLKTQKRKESDRDLLPNRASSATLYAPSTTTELGRGLDMLHYVPMTALLAPQPNVREETLGRRGAESKKKAIIFYMYIHQVCSLYFEV